MKWNAIKALVLSSLGITSVAEDNTLTEEQENTIKASYGDEVLRKFKAGLAAENPEEHSEKIYQAMRAFFAAEAEETASTVQQQLQAALDENKRKDAIITGLMDQKESDPEADTHPFTGRADTKPVMKVMRKAAHYALVFGAISTGGFVMDADASSIDVESLRSEFGTYLSQHQNNLTIHSQIFNDFSSAKHFRSVPAVTEYRAIQAQINSVSQQFNAKWTPAGQSKFTPLTIKNFRHKINVPIIPADVLDSYLLHLYDEGLSPDQMPITKFIINNLVLPKLLDDIEMRMIFKGKYEEKSDPDASSSPEESMDGIEYQLIVEKANGDTRINFYDEDIDWVNSSDEDVVKFVNGFADFADEGLRIKKIYASKSVKKRYQRAYEAVYSGGTKVIGGMNPKAEVDYVEMEIVELEGMAKSPIIFATTPGNMVKLRHKNAPKNVINDVQKHNYEVRLFGEYWLGAGFEIAEFVYAYVPESYTDPQQGLKPSTEFPDGTSPAENGGGNGGSDAGGMP